MRTIEMPSEKYARERLTTGDICTRIVTIAFRETSINGASRLMRENHVGCLVVVEETSGHNIVVGILTDRDIVNSVVAVDLDPATICVGDVMTTDLATAREDDSLIDLMRAMRRKGVRRVPVIGAGGDLCGIVTLDDVLLILSEELNLLVAAIASGDQRERQLQRRFAA